VSDQPIPFERIVFVCTNVRTNGPRVSCGAVGGTELRERLKMLVKDHGLADRIRVCSSGCMDVCEEGPNAMVFPDNKWICGASTDDAESIFEQIREGL
jgi:(2Fe-2S) ferredoxin